MPRKESAKRLSGSRPGRTDASGRAAAGSQRWLQYYVNHNKGSLLSEQISGVAGICIRNVEWASPLVEQGFREYRDEDALTAVDQASLWPLLRQFWPRRGPCWDALGKYVGGLQSSGTGVLLVEAKSYPGEVEGNGCMASTVSRGVIERSLIATKLWLKADPTTDWLGPLYQSANRLAHLYFMREIARVPTLLVNVYFLNDPRTPTTLAQWKQSMADITLRLGLPSTPPGVISVFLEAHDLTTSLT